MTEAICRGSILLGSGCGRCRRCIEERETLLRHVAISNAAIALFDNRRRPHPSDELPLWEKLSAEYDKMRAHLLARAQSSKNPNDQSS